MHEINLELRKQRLIDEAIQRHPGQDLTPCSNVRSLSECFTDDTGALIFWYNVGKDTRAIAEKQ